MRSLLITAGDSLDGVIQIRKQFFFKFKIDIRLATTSPDVNDGVAYDSVR